MMNIFKLITTGIIIASGLLFTNVYAGNPARIGEEGATELLINSWARSSGMADANIASLSGVESMMLNVAGLAETKKTEFVFSRTNWLTGSGIYINSFGFSQKLGKDNNSAFGVSVTSFDFGSIPITTANQPEGGAGTFNIQMINIAVGYSHQFSDAINGGVLVRAIDEGVPSVSAEGVALDAGVQYNTGAQRQIHFGVSLKNVGPTMTFGGDGLTLEGTPQGGAYVLSLQSRSAPYELPSQLRLGGAYDFHLDSTNQMLTIAATFVSNAFDNDQFTIGAEYSYHTYLMLRAGYMYQAGMYTAGAASTVMAGPAAGVSVDIPFGKDKSKRFAIDYSYRVSAPFAGTHTFGARMNL